LEPPSPIILASKSPRRKALLKQTGLTFAVLESDFDESELIETDAAAYVRRLAMGKAASVARRYPNHWIIGADTEVVLDGHIFGKPRNNLDAARTLQKLSGKVHRVLTGYAVVSHSRQHCFVDSCVTEVTFERLTPLEIEWYIDTGEPFNKAGAYAIQGLGAYLVRSINGSYPNVVGLPVNRVVDHLINIGAARLSTNGRNWIESVD
jgi:septum formation protein